jgi:cardiolipin synthase
VARPSLTRRRLLGLDRSGPPPPETLRRQPLHPWTIPNAIGFVRLALVPVFLVLALSSGDGRRASASIIYAVIGGTDYLDGMAARLTGQYSRLGTLLDPLTDRSRGRTCAGTSSCCPAGPWRCLRPASS